MQATVQDLDCHRSVAEVPVRRLSRILLPSLADWLFLCFLLVLFASGAGWIGLLADGDTGWHLRTGEYILRNHAVPTTDLFSFSKSGESWFAWEWGADVIFALIHRYAGLQGIVFFSAVTLCFAGLTLFRYMIWRGAAVHIAILLTLTVMDAAQIHFLARPHIFTLLLIPTFLWMIERDMKRPTWTIWLLAPLAVVWTNLHGGFLVLISSLAVFTAVVGLRSFIGQGGQDTRQRFWRFTGLTAACGGATLINPYGLSLYVHIIEYLRSSWILNSVQEFQSPSFRSALTFKFEILLVLALCMLPALLRRRDIANAALILLWAHQALVSARHIPVFVFIAAAPVASELTALWRRWTLGSPSRSALGVVRDMVADFGGHATRTTFWIPVFLVAVYVLTPSTDWPTDFPSSKFPVSLLARNEQAWSERSSSTRLLSSDSWGGFLIYRFYPAGRVFMDGRSDFYGEHLGKDYVCLRAACADWRQLMNRYAFDSALIPPSWALTYALRDDPEWRVIDEDGVAVWLERVRPQKAPVSSGI